MNTLCLGQFWVNHHSLHKETSLLQSQNYTINEYIGTDFKGMLILCPFSTIVMGSAHPTPRNQAFIPSYGADLKPSKVANWLPHHIHDNIAPMNISCHAGCYSSQLNKVISDFFPLIACIVLFGARKGSQWGGSFPVSINLIFHVLWPKCVVSSEVESYQVLVHWGSLKTTEIYSERQIHSLVSIFFLTFLISRSHSRSNV